MVDVTDDHGWHTDNRLIKVVEEQSPTPPAPKSRTVYYFEEDTFMVRYMYQGHFMRESGNTWTALEPALEEARDSMQSLGVKPEDPLVIEVVRIVDCVRRVKTKETTDWGIHKDEPIYEQLDYPKEVRTEIIWQSTAPDEACCIPLETGEPCGGA